MFNKLFFPTLVIIYPFTLILSNISNFKINYLAAFFLIFLSFKHQVKNIKITLFVFSILIFLLVKFLIYGDFSIKEMVVLVFGPLVFLKFVSDFEQLESNNKNFIVNMIVGSGIFISLLISFQYYGFIPMTLGGMEFLNIVGMGVFGEYDFSYRPSAYFYHPYDTSLALVPFLAFSVIFAVKNPRLKSITFLLIVLVSVYCLQLKVLYGFFTLLIVFAVLLTKYSIKKKYFLYVGASLLLLVIYLSVGDYSREEVSLSAGRLIIWKYNVEEFFGVLSIEKLIFGLSGNPLENNLLWQSDEFFTTHNLYLFLIVNTGILFTPIFVFLMKQTLNTSTLVDFCIIILMITFAFTGDLMIFTSYWICICCVYAISYRFKLNSSQKSLS